MKRFLATLTGIALSSAPGVLAGEARAVAIATNGGSASATATAVGNADSTAIAGATRGGRAVANSNAIGRRNGYAESRSVAVADHGLAVSNADADARGIFGGAARADSESIAATIGGVAISNSRPGRAGRSSAGRTAARVRPHSAITGRRSATVSRTAAAGSVGTLRASVTHWPTASAAVPGAASGRLAMLASGRRRAPTGAA